VVCYIVKDDAIAMFSDHVCMLLILHIAHTGIKEIQHKGSNVPFPQKPGDGWRTDETSG